MDMFGIRSDTGRRIASELGISYGFINHSPLTIRWGSTLYPHLKTLNSTDAIRIAANKPLARRILLENNIPVPKQSRTNFPIVGRPQKHHAGKRFYYCENIHDLERAERKGAVYFSEFYNKQREFRVHIGSGKVLLFSVKLGDKSQKVWNVKNGFHFRHMARSEWMWDNHLMDIQRACKKALEVIGLDFGAVDVMSSDTEDQRFVISEINTAPGGSPLMVHKYASYFKKKLGIIVESEKRDITIGNFEVSSLASSLIIPHKYAIIKTLIWPGL